MSDKPRKYLVGFKNVNGSYEDRPADDWRDELRQYGWSGPTEKHVPANHRGDPIDSIGETPCKCRQDLNDAFEHNAGIDWALSEIKRIFAEAADKRKREGLLSNDEAWNEFFKGGK